MAGKAHPFGSRVVTGLFAFAAAIAMALSNAATAGAVCNQLCTDTSTNTFFGNDAGRLITTGSDNSGFGLDALFSLTSGSADTAVGLNALHENTSGNFNTAIGVDALGGNQTGSNNTAAGWTALTSNRTGYNNTSGGYQSTYSNTSGYNNTALGFNALFNNTTGHSNVAVGVDAGQNLTTGSNNIDIGSFVPGVAGESSTIRLGVQGTQLATYIAGIAGRSVTGADVVVDSTTGRLGVVMSSARYKKDIQDMGATSESLMKLRPVTFRYRSDAQGVTQYGLVAEEVEKVYPELVTYGADGKVETVRYSMLTSMLLNEVEKQSRQIAELKESTRMQIGQIEARHEQELKEMRAAFEGRLSIIEHAMRTRDGNGTLATALDR